MTELPESHPVVAVNPGTTTLDRPVRGKGRVARGLVAVLRFLGLWTGISGIYARAGATCPFCGQPGCPVGLGAAASVGLLGSFFVLKGRKLAARAWDTVRRLGRHPA